MIGLIVATAALASAPTASAAVAPARGTLNFDVQCMIATEQVTNSAKLDATAKSQLSLAMMFYFGRVDSAASGEALKAHIRSAAKRMQGQQLAPAFQVCGQYMTERGSAMEAMGHSLEAEGGGSAK